MTFYSASWATHATRFECCLSSHQPRSDHFSYRLPFKFSPHVTFFAMMCSMQIQNSTPFVLQLHHVQHICVPFSARLSSKTGGSASSALALSLLHPTPAVCGTPTLEARSTIREVEPYDRGFYGGPFGYVASDGCEFCVAIRSALICGAQVGRCACNVVHRRRTLPPLPTLRCSHCSQFIVR